MNKGQYFSFDAIVASMIFILAISSLFVYWEQTKTNFFEVQNIALEANRIADYLLSPSLLGNPTTTSKINNLATYNVNDLKDLFGTNYNVQVIIKVSGIDSSCSLSEATFPTYERENPWKNAPLIGKVKRTIIFKDNNKNCIADIYVYVW